MRIFLNILCEGQTEERFVNELLKGYFRSLDVIVKCVLVTTNRKKDARGGVVNFQHVKGDLEKWMREVKHKKDELHFFTTMLDLYALPTDFPSYEEAKEKEPYSKVAIIEEGLRQTISNQNFIPYIQLHEFEALLFADLAKVEDYFQLKPAKLNGLKKVLTQHKGNPELVNGGVNTAPSKQIKTAIDGYRKIVGVEILKGIGLATLRSRCKHFNEWLQKIEMELGGEGSALGCVMQ